ncbi:purine and uridine phosphorylase [Aspergillus keveii]|uniref:Purine and uridine phosphorylase n=1 Tax=Aspergillus keveii TaxID=714993 RepID=A0ABR4FSX9_9EURO
MQAESEAASLLPNLGISLTNLADPSSISILTISSIPTSKLGVPIGPRKSFTHADYTVGWVCPLEVELIAALEMLDEEHKRLAQQPADHNVYHLGSIAGHNIVIAGLAQAGNCVAATVVAQMRLTSPSIRFGLLVGIGGGVPVVTEEGMLRLGHVVVSKPVGLYSGVIQYDRGKAEVGQFVRTGALAPPPPVLLVAAQSLATERARSLDDPLLQNIRRIDTNLPRLRCYRFPGAENDFLFPTSYIHSLKVHRGTIASADLVLKDGSKRDLLGEEYGVLCFEMEAAGALSDFPCLVIRGISDYCDSHKNDQWHGFAAAAYARQLFFHMPVDQVEQSSVSIDNPGFRRMVQRKMGTGLWLLETTEFREWKAKKGVLYCPGIPGAGKTIFSAVIIDHLQEIKATDHTQQVQKLDDILASILKQLVQSSPVIPDDLRAVYQRRRNDGPRLRQHEIYRFLESIFNVFSQIYIVVDALDECLDSDGTRNAVISNILNLQQSGNLSLLATARHIPEISARFEPYLTLEVQASDADVKCFILSHVHEVSNCLRRNANLSELIVAEIAATARGMYVLRPEHL